ncbi:MAG: DUF2115 domain-containing protein [Methanobrevibacter sp.]|uniref:DUF2115 domain-containing protein n=1 Tax=Methanobrevibacter sp. TaxID=66852 RepID=UPI0026DF8990|nr:DUF2115 domain-containing protein [Methanobrevibacter sp.]MDO5848359.1 DUF2115 domain-containing protein [Methanobrevibacter sp.]
MKDEDIFQDLNRLDEKDVITKKELLAILKKYGRTISPQDLMVATNLLREDGKYVQAGYREKFLETYVKYFILRIKEILNTNDDIEGNVNKELFSESLENLEHQFYKEKEDRKKNSKFPLIYTLASIFSTFINEEPIHPEGSEFPGNLKVYKKDGEFYCPVKDAQKDNPNAVCNFCLAKQTPGV